MTVAMAAQFPAKVAGIEGVGGAGTVPELCDMWLGLSEE